MIVTLTPNPSFDLTYGVDKIVVGGVHRARSATTEAGGKGLNVSRALARAGVASRCLFPGDATDGARLRAMLAADTESDLVETQLVDLGTPVRSNISVIELGGDTTKFNAAGTEIDAVGADALVAAVLESIAQETQWLACCGSLPPGLPADFYAVVSSAVSKSDRGEPKVAVDTSGAALEAAVKGGCDLIKPNETELAELTGRELGTIGDVIEACRAVVDSGVGHVLASLGPAGAVLVGAETELHATAATAKVANTVGAGDALLAGFLAGGGVGERALKWGVAWGAAAVASPTTSFKPPSTQECDAISVGPPAWHTEI